MRLHILINIEFNSFIPFQIFFSLYHVMKSGVKLDWVVLRCDHLICINCVLNKPEELKKKKNVVAGKCLNFLKVNN